VNWKANGKPVWMTLPEAAKACLELLKCEVNKDELEDLNVEKLISFVQVAIQFSK